MTNRAQLLTDYRIDMFKVIPAGTLVTFTDQYTPPGFYQVAPDNEQAFFIHVCEFPKYFKYYTQATIF